MAFTKIWAKGIFYLKSTISTNHFLISVCRAFAFETLDILYVLQGVLLVSIFYIWVGLLQLFQISFISWFRVVESNLIQCRLWTFMWNKFILSYNISTSNKLRWDCMQHMELISFINQKKFYQKALVHQAEFLQKASDFVHFSFWKSHFRKDKFSFSLTIPSKYFLYKRPGICPSVFYTDEQIDRTGA